MHKCQAGLLGYGAWSFLVAAALDSFAERDERLLICTLATDPTRGTTPNIPYQFATDRALSQMSNSEARYDQPSNASLYQPSSRRWLAEALMLVVIPGRQNGTRWGMVSVANILLGLHLERFTRPGYRSADVLLGQVIPKCPAPYIDSRLEAVAIGCRLQTCEKGF